MELQQEGKLRFRRRKSKQRTTPGQRWPYDRGYETTTEGKKSEEGERKLIRKTDESKEKTIRQVRNQEAKEETALREEKDLAA